MLETGMLARSLAGHDHGKVYVVVGLTPDTAYLADGEGKTAASPKKKNRKHIAVIHERCEDTADDQVIRKTLKEYRKKTERNEGCQKQM